MLVSKHQLYLFYVHNRDRSFLKRKECKETFKSSNRVKILHIYHDKDFPGRRVCRVALEKNVSQLILHSLKEQQKGNKVRISKETLT